MNDEDRALGERWLKAGGGWCVGMTSPAVGNNTFHVIALDNEGVPVEWLVTRNYDGPSAIVTAYGRPGWARVVWADQVPDFGNPAVRGLALDVLRKRWKGDIWIGGRWARDWYMWWVCGLHAGADLRVNGGHGFDSEQQALVVAMEAVR